jgi:hypothetical protein
LFPQIRLILAGMIPSNNAAGRSKFHRFCSSSVSPYTRERYGIFVAVWHLVRDGRVTAEEEKEYWSHRTWFEEHLPIPPYHAEGNPERAITWFKDAVIDHPLLKKLEFYQEMGLKYQLGIQIESTNDPGRIVYEDEFQIGAVRIDHREIGDCTDPKSGILA